MSDIDLVGPTATNLPYAHMTRIRAQRSAAARQAVVPKEAALLLRHEEQRGGPLRRGCYQA
jgi:hypothetical protein